MTQMKVVNAYFDWMYDLVSGRRFARGISYRKLLLHLHDVEFIYSIPRDANRADDGIRLRDRFADEEDFPDADLYLEGPCSVLELMVALALYCEEHIMDDPVIGNRTGQWFWIMITNLGLGGMDDKKYDPRKVDEVMERFLRREYEPDGAGGLFKVRNCEDDLRDLEIQYQLYRFINSIT